MRSREDERHEDGPRHAVSSLASRLHMSTMSLPARHCGDVYFIKTSITSKMVCATDATAMPSPNLDRSSRAHGLLGSNANTANGPPVGRRAARVQVMLPLPLGADAGTRTPYPPSPLDGPSFSISALELSDEGWSSITMCPGSSQQCGFCSTGALHGQVGLNLAVFRQVGLASPAPLALMRSRVLLSRERTRYSAFRVT